MEAAKLQTDIAIVGAGIGGCIAALALTSRYSVTLIDKNQTPPPKVGECLPPAAKRVFNKLKLEQFPGKEHLNAKGMASWWGSEQVQITDNLRNPDGFGWHVDRQVLEQDLRSETQNRGVDCYWPYSLDASDKCDDGWLLALTSKSEEHPPLITLRAKLVIDATGRHCSFARQQGAKRQQSDRLVSVWGTFCSDDKNQLANICSTETGWWYCAPIPRMPDNRTRKSSNNYGARVLAYQTDADLLPKDFIEQKTLWHAAQSLPEFANRLSMTEESTVQLHGMVAANSSILTDADFHNWFAIGDAAMSFDPLSSQGMFNAMASAMQLADLIHEHGIESEKAISAISQEFRQQLIRIWHYYQNHKKVYYNQEKRWSDSQFWRRRLV